MKKKVLAVTLFTLALTACGGGKSATTIVSQGKYPVANVNTAATVVDPEEAQGEHYKTSAKLYNDNYGLFYTNYAKANSATSVSERYVYQALAEAKLMESATLLPGTANGGSYAISRVVPKTITPCLWGKDSYRYHNALVKKGNPLTPAERNELKTKYKEISDSESTTKQKDYENAVVNYFETKGYEFDNNYTQYYDGDPTVYDILNSYYATDSDPLVNTFDGLVEYNDFNEIAPALAESWTVSEDGTQYTFKIRSGAVWTNREGTKVADVKADDFVAAFQHMLDCAAGLEFLVDGVVEGAHEYLNASKADKDFSVVGVTANDAQNTVTYTLTDECPYFMTMLGYSIFAPMSRSYYTSKGGKFGAEFDADAESYTYAKDYSSIAYCGPYTIKTFTAQSTFEFIKNNSYWNKDNINIDSIVWLENDGSDTLKAYNGMKTGEVVGCSLNTNALALSKTDGYYNSYAYVSDVDASSYPFYMNINRKAYANFNDATAAVSNKTADQKALSEAAMKNVYIRLGIAFSIDRVAYYAQSKGSELACNAMTNSYTPGNFVKTTEDVVADVNGIKVTFPAGTYYGAIMQFQINADGLPIKVWNQAADGGIGSGFGFDGWHNIDAAVSYFAKGVEELKAQGITIDAEHPLNIELTTYTAVTTSDNQIKAMGASIQYALGNLVKVTYCDAVTRKNALYAEYYADQGDQTNCDIMTISGWGPDYGDPATYLDTFLPQTGGMLKCSGIY